MLKNKKLSILIIIVMLLNIISTNASAEELTFKENSPIYNVVVPTNYSFTVDPYELLQDGTMIASPEFQMINKSNIPIKIDLSFRLTTKDGIQLDYKNSRNMVGSNSLDNEIWLAAVFNSKITKVITENKILRTVKGDIIYQFSDGYGTNSIEVNPDINKKLKVKDDETINNSDELANDPVISVQKNEIITIKADGQEDIVKTVSGSALEVEANNIIPIQDSGQNDEEAKAVSGSAILAEINYNSPLHESEQSYEDAKAVSGSAIEMKVNNSIPLQESVQSYETSKAVSSLAVGVKTNNSIPLQESVQSYETSKAVSGSAIGVKTNNSILLQESEQSDEAAKAVSGSAIEIEVNSNIPIQDSGQSNESSKAVSGSAITIQTNVNDTSDNNEAKKDNIIPSSETKPNIPTYEEKFKNNDIKTNEEGNKTKSVIIKGTPVTYEDTIKVFGEYGDIGTINENSPNVVVINNEWNTKSIVLDRAKTYQLLDGTMVTGEVADNNCGVATFRLVGTLNAKVKWSDIKLKATVKYTFKRIDNNENESNNETKNNKILDNNVESYQQFEKIKSEYNNNENKNDSNLQDQNDDVKKDTLNKTDQSNDSG